MNRFFLLALAVATACQREAARASADSQRVSTAAPSAASTSEARKVCESVAQRWREVAFSHVGVRDTVADPVNHDAAHPNRPDEALGPTPACLVAARADSGSGNTPLYWPAADWVPILVFSADGPDGGSMTYQRGLTRCQVSNSWDGDDDSTYVPQKWFEQRTTCWQHNRALAPSDTAQPTTEP